MTADQRDQRISNLPFASAAGDDVSNQHRDELLVAECRPHRHPQRSSRREILRQIGAGMGLVGLAAAWPTNPLVASTSPSAAAGQSPTTNPLTPKHAYFAPRAKRVIHLLMNGGVSHVDTFDYKPELTKYMGQRPAEVDLRTQRKTTTILPSPFSFQRHGESGLWVSELFPHVASRIDDLCVISSMHTDIPEHAAALSMLAVGANELNRPCLGSWLVYGLGTENQNLPGFVVLCHKGAPRPFAPSWSSAFLPSGCSGTFVDTRDQDPDKCIAYLVNPWLTPQQQQLQLKFLNRLNRLQQSKLEREAALEARIRSFELAFRMQLEAPEAFDIRSESQATLDLYGIGDEPTFSRVGGRAFGGFAEGCLLARRLSERGVRMVQLAFAPDIAWDDHADIQAHRAKARECDQAIAALLTDLKTRGLLDETLVVWAGEFGRTPTFDPTGKKPGRDHNHYGYTVWLAGGGVRGGMQYGATDIFGMRAVENQVHVHDLHATILHLLGIDHEQLTFRYSGRDFRLTDVEGRVVSDIFS